MTYYIATRVRPNSEWIADRGLNCERTELEPNNCQDMPVPQQHRATPYSVLRTAPNLTVQVLRMYVWMYVLLTLRR